MSPDEDFGLPDDDIQYPADVEAPPEKDDAFADMQEKIDLALADPLPSHQSVTSDNVTEPLQASEFIDIKPEKEEPPTLIEEFVRKHAAEQRASLPEYKPPPLTERMLTAREIEMQAGAKRVQHFEEHKRIHQAQKLSAAEQQAAGTSVPVFRPEDYVPVDPALSKLSKG